MMKGFILVTTVIMIAIISLLWISLVQHVWFYSKLMHDRTLRQSYNHALDEAIMPIIRAHDCVISEQNPYRLRQRFLEGKYCFWRKKDHVFYYVLSDLGFFPCIKMSSQQGSHQWLLIIGGPHADVVEVRIAEPAITKACDQNISRIIPAGIMSFTT